MSSPPGPLKSSGRFRMPDLTARVPMRATRCNVCGEDHVRTKTPRCHRKPEHCDECGKEHPIVGFCPFVPCKICFKPDHYIVGCTFRDLYKRGEEFDSKTYEIVCHCNGPFDTDTWGCNYCGLRGHPKLKRKICKACNAVGDHITRECPNEKELAAKIEAAACPPPVFIPYPEYLRMKAAAASSSSKEKSIAPDDDITTFNKMRSIAPDDDVLNKMRRIAPDDIPTRRITVDPEPPTN